MANLGGVVIDLKANTAGFVEGMNKAVAKSQTTAGLVNRSLATMNAGYRRLTSTIGGFGRAITSTNALFAAFAGAGVGAFVKSSLNAADATAKAARNIGFTAETLQELQFATGLAGVSTEALTNNLGGFAKRLGELKAETGAMVTFLQKYDTTLLENLKNAKSQEEALYLVGEAIANAGNAADKAAIASAAFGRSGMGMIDVFKNGTQELDAFRQKARDLGLVLSTELLEAAEEANDQMEILGQVMMVKLRVEAVKLAPDIIMITDALMSLVPAITVVAQSFAGVIIIFKEFAKAINTYVVGPVTALWDITKRLSGAGSMMLLDKQIDSFKSAGKATDELVNKQKNLAKLPKFEKVSVPILPERRDRTPGLSREQTKEAAAAAAAAKKSADAAARHAEALAKLNDGLNRETEELRRLAQAQALGAAQHAATKDMIDAENVARAAGVELTTEQTQRVISQSLANKALERAIADAEERMRQFGDMAKQVGDRVSDAFWDATTQGNSLRDTIRSLLSDIARMVYNQTIGSQLSGGIAGLITGGLGRVFGGGGVSAPMSPAASAAAGITWHSSGGVVQRPTTFATRTGMAGMGEAGAEAILPLKRDGSGNLGVVAQGAGGGMTYNMSFNIDARGSQLTEPQFRAIVNQSVSASLKAVADTNKRNPAYLRR